MKKVVIATVEGEDQRKEGESSKREAKGSVEERVQQEKVDKGKY